MTTIPQEGVLTPQALETPAAELPEVLTEEHHEALAASWEMPAYERTAPATPKPVSHKPLYVGLIAGALGLAIGGAVGYWARSQTMMTPEPFVITNLAGPVDANGQTLGRRVAPFDTTLPIGITIAGPVDANGQALGRRVAPVDTMTPTEIPTPVPVDANGQPLGRRVAPVDR